MNQLHGLFWRIITQDTAKQPVVRPEKNVITAPNADRPPACADARINYRNMNRSGWKPLPGRAKVNRSGQDRLRRNRMSQINERGIWTGG